VAEHHAGKGTVDHHLSQVVGIPTSGEEPIRDETTAGAKNKILLDVGGMMKPVADNEAGEGNAKVVGKGLKLSSSCHQKVWTGPEHAGHAKDQLKS